MNTVGEILLIIKKRGSNLVRPQSKYVPSLPCGTAPRARYARTPGDLGFPAGYQGHAEARFGPTSSHRNPWEADTVTATERYSAKKTKVAPRQNLNAFPPSCLRCPRTFLDLEKTASIFRVEVEAGEFRHQPVTALFCVRATFGGLVEFVIKYGHRKVTWAYVPVGAFLRLFESSPRHELSCVGNPSPIFMISGPCSPRALWAALGAAGIFF